MSAKILGIPKGALLIILGGLCFSTTGTTQALSPTEASPVIIGALRLLGGSAALFIWCAIKKQIPNIKTWDLGLTLLSALGILFYQITFFAAVARTGVAVGTVVAIGISPLMATLLGFIFLKEKPSLIWYPATFLGILGVAFLSLTDEIKSDFLGLLLAIIAGTSYAIYSVFSKKLVMHKNPEAVMAVLFAIGAILVSPVLFFFPTAWIITSNGLIIFAHLGIVTTAIAYTLYLAGLKITPISTGTTLGLSEPLGAALLGILFLHEPLTFLSLFGIVLLFSSTLILSIYPSR